MRRELVALPDGGLVVDTPGLRELGLWDASSGMDAVFGDVSSEIEELAVSCRFADCAHRLEPGCAVKAALADGSLDSGRFDAYRKLEREAAWIARRKDHLAMAQERKKWKAVSKAMRDRESWTW